MSRRLTDQDRVYRAITEAEWSRTVVDYAHAQGWLIAHFRPAQNAQGGWRTPVAADGAGFPDLVLARRDREPLFVELKREIGRLSSAQIDWMNAINGPFFTWRPSDWPQVKRVLK
jgi:hypothetical protein